MDVTHLKSNNNSTALMGAAIVGNEEVTKLLLEKSAEVNIKTDSGSTALISAAINGNNRVARLLLQKSADTSAIFRGKNAHDWAIAQSHPEIAEIISKHSV